MADEIKKIVTIDASASVKSLRDLQQQLDQLRVGLLRLDGTSEEYQQQLVKIKKAQGDYNAEMRLAVKESNAVKGSYNDLLNQLNRLKQQWKATGDAAERARLTQQIQGVKSQLTDLDHSIGNYQRNVGNYWGSIRNGVAKVTAAIFALRGAWKTFEGAMNETQRTGDALRITLDSVKDSYHSLMTAVVSGDWSVFADGFWAVYDAAKAAGEAIDQLGNTQIAFDYLSSTNMTAFNKQYNIWKDKSSTEEQKKAAQEQMRQIIDAQYKYAEGYNKQALDAYRAIVVKEAGEANLSIAQVTAEQFRQAMLIDVSGNPEQARAEIERQYQDYLQRLREYGKNNLTAQQNLKKQYADVIAIHAMLQLMKDDELQGLSQILQGMERATQAAQNMQRRMLRGGGGTSSSTTSTSPTQAVDYALATSENEAVMEEEVGLTAETQKQLDAIHAEAAAARKQQQDEELQALMDFGDAYVRTQEAITDNVKRLLEEERKEREYKAEVEKQIEKDNIETLQATATATANIMGNVASAYSAYIQQRLEGGKISEEQAEREFENVKAIQYAQTWINTLAGMVSVWAGEGTNAAKAVQSVAVFTQGLAATMQIANTTLGSVSAASQAVTSAAVAAPVVINTMPQVQALTSASQEDVLNARAEAQRVYVVYSDIAEAGRKVQVTNSESRF